jgi:hypothetical protein
MDLKVSSRWEKQARLFNPVHQSESLICSIEVGPIRLKSFLPSFCFLSKGFKLTTKAYILQVFKRTTSY